jgi:hypothetical protein
LKPGPIGRSIDHPSHAGCRRRAKRWSAKWGVRVREWGK